MIPAKSGYHADNIYASYRSTVQVASSDGKISVKLSFLSFNLCYRLCLVGQFLVQSRSMLRCAVWPILSVYLHLRSQLLSR